MATSAITKAEQALERGDYGQCLIFLEPLARKFPLGTQEGAKIRMLMITAWMGQGEDQRAIATCKLLAKIKDPQIRQQAKQLISILEAPNLPRPEDWSVTIPKLDLNPDVFQGNVYSKKEKGTKEITFHPPTGPTKALDIGFSVTLLAILISLTILSSYYK